jgi:hypothetical protein
VEDLDREVLAHLAEDLLVFLLDDLARPMVRIDDVVADLEIDALCLAREVEVLDLLGRCIGDGVLLYLGRPCAGPPGPVASFQVCK